MRQWIVTLPNQTDMNNQHALNMALQIGMQALHISDINAYQQVKEWVIKPYILRHRGGVESGLREQIKELHSIIDGLRVDLRNTTHRETQLRNDLNKKLDAQVERKLTEHKLDKATLRMQKLEHVIKQAGVYLARHVDDDDEWLPSKLEKQVAILRATGCGMASTEAWRGRGRFDPRKTYPRYLAEWARRPAALPARFTRQDLERENPIIHSSVLIERTRLLAAGGYDELPIGGVTRDGRLLVEDWELWKRCLRTTDCAFLPEPLVYYDGQPSVYSENRFMAGARRVWENWRAPRSRAPA